MKMSLREWYAGSDAAHSYARCMYENEIVRDFEAKWGKFDDINNQLKYLVHHQFLYADAMIEKSQE